MKILQDVKVSPPSQCNYLSNQVWSFAYFFATDLNEPELEYLLSTGWRKFGYYFFKPECENCQKCIPLRVDVKQFVPTKSQRRIIKKNNNIEVEFQELDYSDEIFNIYQIHSLERFGKKEKDKNEFISSFFSKSCPTFLSMYYLNKKLIGTGFLDITDKSLSSIYYIFDTNYNKLSPGTFSVLREIGYAAELGLNYYYLGYYIDECKSMVYKGNFTPYETYNWNTKKWGLGKN